MIRIRSILKYLQNAKSIATTRSGQETLVNSQGLFFRQTNTPINLRQNFLGLTLGNSQPQRSFTSEAGKVQPPIGVSDFRKLIEHTDPEGKPYLFVDKSLFIKDILVDSSDVILITRARRFGKTLNMSMLHHFFSKEVDNKSTKELFDNLKISKYPDYIKRYQGLFPVIFLTFKDIKSGNFKDAHNDFSEVIRTAYKEYSKLALSKNSPLDNFDKKDYKRILDRKASDSIIKGSLKKLTFYLYQIYKVKPIVLIDEYDTPIQTAYTQNYYEEMIIFMKEFFGAGLKDNSYLEKAILTGILRISKESLFSDLNNVKTYSLLNSRYEEHFGFTEEEVEELLEKSGLDKNIKEVSKWYNGYQIGNTIIYNPWSITNYIQEKGRFGSYWINTSENSLIRDLLIRSSTNFKSQFEILLQDKPIEMLIDERIAFNTLEKNESTVWSLLLMSGYLKAKVIKETDQGNLCQLSIPNNEVKGLYKKFIAEWLSGANNTMIFNTFINNLLAGNMEDFEDQLRAVMLQTFSTHDIKGKNTEKFFHEFMLGLFAGIDKNHYKIDSNKESGLGRYDIIIAPKDTKKLGIIIEIKSIDKDSLKELKDAAINALQQIDDRQYGMTTLLDGTKNCLKIGIAFSGKELVITYRMDKLDQKLTIKNNLTTA